MGVVTELFFIMSSIWHHQFYYLFGFVALAGVLLVITCAEVAIAVTYFQLTAENYHWWWLSFTGCGSSGIFVFLNAVMYYNTRMNISHLAGTILFFGYSAVM